MKIARYMLSALLLLFACGLLITACQKPATDEIMAAEDAIKAAAQAGAEEYSPKLLEKAYSFLQEAKMLNEQGHYSEARKKAEFAQLRADESMKNAERMGKVQKAHVEGEAPMEAPAEETEQGSEE